MSEIMHSVRITIKKFTKLFNFQSVVHIFDPLVKKVETELLYDSILRLAERNVVIVRENLKPQLLA